MKNLMIMGDDLSVNSSKSKKKSYSISSYNSESRQSSRSLCKEKLVKLFTNPDIKDSKALPQQLIMNPSNGRNGPIKKMTELSKKELEMFSEGFFSYRDNLKRVSKIKNSIKLSNKVTKCCLECNNRETIQEIVMKNLCTKYRSTRESYYSKVISDIIYNESTHLVSAFKDFLISDDISEFFKRFYSTSETESRLKKIFDFYEEYSKVFPNFVALEEKKYMFKNISKKQRRIDEQQKVTEDLKTKKHKKIALVLLL